MEGGLHRRDLPDFDRAARFEGRAGFCDLRGVGQILRFDDRKSADDFFAFGEWAVGNHAAGRDVLAFLRERRAPVFEFAFFAEFREPSLPAFHACFPLSVSYTHLTLPTIYSV